MVSCISCTSTDSSLFSLRSQYPLVLKVPNGKRNHLGLPSYFEWSSAFLVANGPESSGSFRSPAGLCPRTRCFYHGLCFWSWFSQVHQKLRDGHYWLWLVYLYLFTVSKINALVSWNSFLFQQLFIRYLIECQSFRQELNSELRHSGWISLRPGICTFCNCPTVSFCQSRTKSHPHLANSGLMSWRVAAMSHLSCFDQVASIVYSEILASFSQSIYCLITLICLVCWSAVNLAVSCFYVLKIVPNCHLTGFGCFLLMVKV